MSLTWDGLDEFRDALRALPDVCQGEAAKAIEGGVNSAFVTISGVYGAHRFTGNLQKGLRIKKTKGGFTLASTAPHALLFERGTQTRHYVTVNGVRHLTGRMPPNPIFTRTVAREGRKLTEAFTAMLFRQGATKVTVDA